MGKRNAKPCAGAPPEAGKESSWSGRVTDKDLYAPLRKNFGGTGRGSLKEKELSVGALLPTPPGTRLPSDDVLHARVRNRTLLLDKESGNAGRAAPKRPRPRWTERRAAAQSRARVTKKAVKHARSSKVTIPEAEQRYEIYKPLAELWQDYAKKALGDGDRASMGDRLLRMDLHGAVVEVVRARDPGLVGIRGILIVETANTIMVVKKSNRVVTIRKCSAVISVDVGKNAYEIALPLLPYRASERSARKLKKKHMYLF